MSYSGQLNSTEWEQVGAIGFGLCESAEAAASGLVLHGSLNPMRNFRSLEVAVRSGDTADATRAAFFAPAAS
jgi:hypothetical protein